MSRWKTCQRFMCGCSARIVTNMRKLTWLLVGSLCLSASPRIAQAELGEDSYLLHTQVPQDLFSRLLLWDKTQREWRVPRVGENPGQKAPILVVHLWADYCKPCRKEFPMLRDLAEAFGKSHPGRVEFIFLSETFSSTEMNRFLNEEAAQMPKTPLYYDGAESFAKLVRANCPSGGLTLPVTLLLDDKRVVRQAIIGSMISQRGALAAGISKLAQLRSPSASSGLGTKSLY